MKNWKIVIIICVFMFSCEYPKGTIKQENNVFSKMRIMDSTLTVHIRILEKNQIELQKQIMKLHERDIDILNNQSKIVDWLNKNSQ